MNNSFREGSIGTDPTNLPVIENLDVAPKQKKEKKEKQNNGLIKKLLFTVLIVILMLGVAGGVYYYLNLGQKNKKTSNFTLNDINIFQGQELSSNVADYGNFDGIDTSICKIDTSAVQIAEAGTYKYKVTCYKTTKEANVVVTSFNNFKVTTRFLNRKIGTSIKESNLVKTANGFTYTFVNTFDPVEGINTYIIDVEDSVEKHEIVYGFVNYLSDDYSKILECTNNNIKDRVFIDNNNNKMDNVLRVNEIKYTMEDDMVRDIMQINNGILSKNGFSGFAVVDYDNLIIRIYNELGPSNLDTNFPNQYDEIKNYYQNLNYTCIDK